MPNWNLPLKPIISVENLQKTWEQRLWQYYFFHDHLPEFHPRWEGTGVGLMQSSPLPVAGCERGETIYPWGTGRARGGGPVSTRQSTQIPKEVTAALVSGATILLLGNFTWRRANASALHHVPPWWLCRATACTQEVWKIGTILQIGDFSVLPKEGCGKSCLRLPCVSPFPSGKLSLMEVEFWHLMHGV